MEQQEPTIWTNMCMIYDDDRIVVLDKVNDSYTGITFPGGHVRKGEPFADAVIREVEEETGLCIKAPELCGIYNWVREDGIRYVVLLYKAEYFYGELCSSEEGVVFWIDKKEFLKQKLAHGMDKVFTILEGEPSECFFSLEDGMEYLK